MASENYKKAQSREEMRFEREAKALQKNLEKRKLQQQKREELKKSRKNKQTENQD